MILVTGSIAFDYLMDFKNEFKSQILPKHLNNLSVSFLTDNFRKYFGGTAPNIAHSLKLLDESPLIMGTAGYDFEDYMTSLNWRGIPTKNITILDNEITASAFITTDKTGNQICFFHPGAMNKAAQNKISKLKNKIKLAIIAPEKIETMMHYVRECQKYNIPYVFDPGQNISLFSKELYLEAIKTAKVLILNQYEWGIFHKITKLTEKQVSEFCEYLVITLGKDGSKFYKNEQCHQCLAIKPHEIKDPTGCGDAYRAGFLKGLLHNLPLEQTAKIASLSATYCLEEHGTQNHKYTIEEFNKRFQES